MKNLVDTIETLKTISPEQLTEKQYIEVIESIRYLQRIASITFELRCLRRMMHGEELR